MDMFLYNQPSLLSGRERATHTAQANTHLPNDDTLIRPIHGGITNDIHLANMHDLLYSRFDCPMLEEWFTDTGGKPALVNYCKYQNMTLLLNSRALDLRCGVFTNVDGSKYTEVAKTLCSRT